MIFCEAFRCLIRAKATRVAIFVLSLMPLYVMPVYSLGKLQPNDEASAISIFLIGKSTRFEKIQREYMSRLSPGGKALFLANRRDYAEAMKQLEKCPRCGSQSADYIRAFCLEGLGRHREAIAAYRRAESKVDVLFNPSAMFYLHSAIPFFEIGDYKTCTKYLDTAFQKVRIENKGRTNKIASVLFISQRLKPVMLEKSGKYKEALAAYADLFGSENYHIDKPFIASAGSTARAKEWLAANKTPPADDQKAAYTYFVECGVSNFVLGNDSAAETALLKAISLEKPPITVSDRRFGNQKIHLDWLGRGVAIAPAAVVSANREAPVRWKDRLTDTLTNVYVRQKKYAEGCKIIRRRLMIEPWNVFQIFGHVIRMRDVRQVVTQQDVDVHSEDLEMRLESSPLLQLAPTGGKEIERAFEKDMGGPLFDKASGLAQQGRFKECLPVMDALIREKRNLPAPESVAEFHARYQFGSLHLYAVELLRIGVAFAAGSKDAVLSFGNFGRTDSKSRRIWQPVEDSLLGRPAKIGEVDIETRSVFPRILTYEQFAAGVHLMKVGNLKEAAAAFGKVYTCPVKQQDHAFSTFAKALKKYCESR